MMRFMMMCVAAGLLASELAAAEKEPIAKDMSQLARQLAGKLSEALNTLPVNPTSKRARVALVPFGDGKAENRATRAAGETAKVIQGELFCKLSELSQRGSYVVLSPTGLKQAFASARVDVTELNPNDPKATGKVIDRVGLSAILVGSYEERERSVMVKAVIIRADGGCEEVATAYAEPEVVNPTILEVRPPLAKSRFRVRVLDKDGNTLPFSQVQDDAGSKPGRLTNTYWLPLERSRRGETYSLVIEHVGTGTGMYYNEDREKDARRLYGCALRVDGVDTFSHEINGEEEFVALTPDHCCYWLLTPPGHVVLKLPTKTGNQGSSGPKAPQPRNYEVKPLAEVEIPAGSSIDRGKGHAIQRIPGFQIGGAVAQSFTFAVPHEALATQLGVTEELGLITAHFAPELIEGDKATAASLLEPNGPMATLAGPTVDHEVTPINVKLHDEFEEVVRIYYYEKQDGETSPVPKGKLVAVPVKN